MQENLAVFQSKKLTVFGSRVRWCSGKINLADISMILYMYLHVLAVHFAGTPSS